MSYQCSRVCVHVMCVYLFVTCLPMHMHAGSLAEAVAGWVHASTVSLHHSVSVVCLQLPV